MDINENAFLITLGKRAPGLEPEIIIWKLNLESKLFELHQEIYEGDPEFLSTISTTSYGHFISVTHDYKKETLDFGKIIIYR